MSFLFDKPMPGMPIRWEHPHSNGLVFACLFNEGSGLPFDCVHGLRGAPTGAIQWRRSGLYFSSNTGIYVDFGTHQSIPGVSASDPCTIVIGAIVDNTSNAVGPIVTGGHSISINTSNRYFMRLDYDTTDLSSSITGFNLLQPGQVGFSYRGDALSTTVGRYRDGHVQGVVLNTNPAGTYTPNISSVRIGQFQGVILYAYIYNRVLPGGMIVDIHSDPYAMFRARRVFSISSTLRRITNFRGGFANMTGGHQN